MAGSSETYIQCGLWGFMGVLPTLADRLERRQGKGLSNSGINYSELLDDDRRLLDDWRVFNQEILMARRSNDFYPTPSWATERLLGLFPLAGTVGEPCSGAGDVANVLRQHNEVWPNDIDRDHVADSYYDLTDPQFKMAG